MVADGVGEENLKPDDSYTADAVFFSSTSSCVLPVTQGDKCQINDGKLEPLTRQLLSKHYQTVGLNIVEQAQQIGL